MFKKAERNKELDPLSYGTVSVSHICFADDLMIFLRMDKRNARRLKLLLDEFSSLLGLSINYHKSAVYFGGTTEHQQWITSHLGQNIGELPVRNQGLPLISKHLSASACTPLI